MDDVSKDFELLHILLLIIAHFIMMVPIRVMAFLKATEVDASHFIKDFKPQAGSDSNTGKVSFSTATPQLMLRGGGSETFNGNVISCPGCNFIIPQSGIQGRKIETSYYHDADGFLRESSTAMCDKCLMAKNDRIPYGCFSPQSGTESAYTHMLSSLDRDIFKASLPRGPECQSCKITSQWVTMTPLYCNSALTENDVVFPGLPIIFSPSDVCGKASISDFIVQALFDAQKQHELVTLADLSMCNFVPTCWGKLLLARRDRDFASSHYFSRGFSQYGGFYALHSDSMNPLLLYYIPQEAIMAAGLIFGRRPMSRLRKLLIDLYSTDRLPVDNTAVWMRIIYNYSKQLTTTSMGRPDVGVSDGHNRDQSHDESDFGPQSGISDSSDMDTVINDVSTSGETDNVDSSDPASMDVSTDLTAATNKAHTACAVTQTTSVDPGLHAGFGSRMAYPARSAGIQQEKAIPQYKTLNKGTRFERQVRLDR